MKALSRLDTSPFARWWWTVDRVSLALIALIVMIGAVLLLAAGPAAAARLHISDSFYFPLRQFVFLAPALGVMVGVSLMTPLQARRLAVVVFGVSLFLMTLALFVGPDINGAKRWLAFGPFSLQPSEFAKPGFVVAIAWMLAEAARDRRFPGRAIAGGMYVAFVALLINQPDYGQTMLVTAAGAVVFFVIGWNWTSIAALGLAASGAIAGGYLFAPHIAKRIDGFFNPDGPGAYQVNKALEAISHGGLFGRGAEGATVKMQLPDAHTDFIFAVAGEEGGFILAVVVVTLFAALVSRFFARASGLRSLFAQSAVSGLAALIGLQSFINIGVNLRVLPAKGMTLPFISYGGSSLLATGLTFGLILALSRTETRARRRKEIMP
ncbi:MAG: cell division protein FtsW [Alphaproteobacteria bacterium]|nr:cell division protein FtsW [Alphaproteobacteria bacterium]